MHFGLGSWGEGESGDTPCPSQHYSLSLQVYQVWALLGKTFQALILTSRAPAKDENFSRDSPLQPVKNPNLQEGCPLLPSCYLMAWLTQQLTESGQKALSSQFKALGWKYKSHFLQSVYKLCCFLLITWRFVFLKEMFSSKQWPGEKWAAFIRHPLHTQAVTHILSALPPPYCSCTFSRVKLLISCMELLNNWY